jgi:hypothetical protein
LVAGRLFRISLGEPRAADLARPQIGPHEIPAAPPRVASRARGVRRRPSAGAASINDVYLLGPDSEPHPGVPQGKVTDWEKLPSQAYPGTLHDFCVYVPAQYDPADGRPRS